MCDSWRHAAGLPPHPCRYAFLALITTSIILSTGAVHKFRYGLIGIFIPLTYLLMSTRCGGSEGPAPDREGEGGQGGCRGAIGG